MNKEQLLASLLRLYRQFKAQGVDVVYGVSVQGRFYLGVEPATRIRGSDEVPLNRELRTEDDVRTWLAS